jgi:hypothetical protein
MQVISALNLLRFILIIDSRGNTQNLTLTIYLQIFIICHKGRSGVVVMSWTFGPWG